MNLIRKLTKILPQSFFSRTFCLVLVAILFSKFTTFIYLLLNDDILVDKQYSYGTAALIRAYWAAEDDFDRQTIANAANLQEHSESPLQNVEHWPYTQIFSRQLQEELGANTQIKFSVNPDNKFAPFERSLNPSLWVYAPHLGANWLEIKLYPRILNSNKLIGLIVWSFSILLVSVLAAYLFMRQINAPFAKLLAATKQVGRGRLEKIDLKNAPSEILILYQAFNKMIEDVATANTERAIMLAGISHDLRTPLTRLRLALEMLQSADNKELVQGMIMDVNDGEQIISQFIEFVQHSRANKNFNACDMSAILTEITATFERLGNQVDLHINEDLPPFLGQEISLKRMFYNLINNAFNHGAKMAQITAFVQDQNLIITIIDDGHGINPLQLEQVFMPFMCGDLSRHKLGSGLGLAIVQRICEQHFGAITLENILPNGLKVMVSLPLKN